MNERGEREETIVETALRLPPKERAEYLDKTLPNESQLRRRVLQAIESANADSPNAASDAPPRLQSTITLRPSVDEPGEKPGDQVGPYKLLEKMGEGGMGSVWVAEQRGVIQRKVALKVIKLGMDTKQVIARFEAERQALALMDHPNIARVFDAGTTQTGRPFFVMELVNGVRITGYCDLHNLSTRDRLALFVQVCRAVGHAHQKGIVHRDIKPPNILVTVHDNAPMSKIIDFGIAKAFAGQRLTDKTVYTAFEEFIGTPAYMSPEQAEMNPLGIDARSDIYALGVLLYELLTGLTPFDAGRLQRLGPDEIRRIIREEDPPRPSTKLTTLAADAQAVIARHRRCDPPSLLGSVRGDLDWIVMKCLEKDRTRRYESAENLAADVQHWLKNEAVVARPPSLLYHLGKRARRHKPALRVASVTLAVTCAAVVVLVVFSPGLFSRRPPGPQQRLARATELLSHYDREGAIPGAMAELKKALSVEPENPQLWAKLGWANWLQYGEDDREETRWEAFRCSSNALNLNPHVAEAHFVQGVISARVGDLPAAINHLLRAKELTRSANAVFLVALATACQASGEPTNAQAYAELAEKVAGTNWHAWDRLGYFHYKSQGINRDLSRARTSLERAVKIAPDSPLAHRELGNILLMQTNVARAFEEFKQSLVLRRTPPTLSAIGSVYLVRREYATALDYFSQASQADPANFQYHSNIGLALRKSGRQAEAAQHFKQALQQTQDRLSAGGEKPMVRAYQGLFRAALDQQAEARQDLEQAVKEAGVDVSVLGIVRDGYSLLEDASRVEALGQLIKQRRD
jgi:serine/threonine protein kinase/Tfp pilus assembly protein PilF